jgi:hypothetical protein
MQMFYILEDWFFVFHDSFKMVHSKRKGDFMYFGKKLSEIIEDKEKLEIAIKELLDLTKEGNDETAKLFQLILQVLEMVGNNMKEEVIQEDVLAVVLEQIKPIISKAIMSIALLEDNLGGGANKEKEARERLDKVMELLLGNSDRVILNVDKLSVELGWFQ